MIILNPRRNIVIEESFYKKIANSATTLLLLSMEK
nr:MAG TPA: hypothetical protein [Caudoviricetes sp.]